MLIPFIGVILLFWGGYYRLTRGAVVRHVAFLHFAIYFFAIYLAAYPLWLETGGVNMRYLGSVMAYPLLALLGMGLASLIAPITAFRGDRITADRRELRLVVVIVAVFLAMYAVYLRSLGSEIPLFGVITGGDLKASRLARYLATKGYTGEGVGGLRLFYWVPRLMLDYFASFTVVFAFYLSRARGRSFAWFLPIFLGLVVLTLLQVEKYPAMKLAVILALCLFNWRYPVLRLRAILLGALLIVFGTFFMGFVYGTVAGGYRTEGREGVFEKIQLTGELGIGMLTTRGMVGQAKPLRVIYEIVPSYYDFFGGRTLANPHDLLPYEKVTLPFIVSDTYLTNEPGVQGSDPTVFFGEVYANWGVTVSLIAMFLFGFLAQLGQHALARRIDDGGTCWDIAFFYLMYLWLGDFALSFSTPYYDERAYFFVGLIILRRIVIGSRAAQAVAAPWQTAPQPQ